MQYDPFQQQAIDYINEGYSVIVAAPTGAGKTAIAEHVIEECLNKGKKVIYTAPIKALSNQKYRDFQENTHHHVGILTGDVSLNPEADVLIMTTEIFRNKVLEDRRSLDAYSWIVFDEIHYIDDFERGSVWEESLIFLPEHMKVLGLSATIPNIDELSQWIQSIHQKEVKVVKEDKRPVPLHFYFQCQNKVYDDFKKLTRFGFQGMESYMRRGGKVPHYVRLRPNQLHPLIDHLSKYDLLPCIYFVFSRRKTELLAGELKAYDFLKDEEPKQIRELFDQLCRRFDLQDEESAKQIRPLVLRGIAYHHAGMLPTLKEVVERLFTSRLIKVIFTTETFALGINMPARTVAFDEVRKYYGGEGPNAFAVLRTRDFYQMAGRAGRRGIDVEGFVFTRINPHDIGPQRLHDMIYGKPERINSQFNSSYATILNLYQHYGENLYDIYPRSFHYYQVRPFLRKRALDHMKAKVNLLKELRFIEDGRLSRKGQFAAQVYGYELILSELYDTNVLEQISEAEVGVLALACVFEARKGTTKPPLSHKADSLESLTRRVMKQINKVERTYGLRDYTKRYHFHLSPAMEAWIKGASFDEILKETEADEGEIVRAFRMCIQVLNEIAQAPVSHVLKSKIYSLKDKINRDVIDSEKQLRR
ncbi:MAG TPA: DEAD/DEAH box helicase [Candidatus Omnitrophota bacterium]|nr:DEAD/DEAH box helicase [Candidatus Omnitrophota bacterium]